MRWIPVISYVVTSTAWFLAGVYFTRRYEEMSRVR